MSTSLYEYEILFATADVGDDDPHDTSLALTLANNALHFADEAGQVRVNDGAVGGTLSTESLSSGDDGEWFHIITYGPWPMTIGPDGIPYSMRVRLGGKMSQAGAYTVTMRAVLASERGVREAVEATAVGDNVLEVTTSSTTAAWLDDKVLTLDEDQVALARSTLATIDGVAGDPVDTEAVMVVVSLWSNTDNVATTGVVTNAYAAEYLAP